VIRDASRDAQQPGFDPYSQDDDSRKCQPASSHKTRPADPNPLGSAKWLNHGPRSARARKNPVVAHAEPDGSRESGVYQASFVIVATLAAQRKEPHPEQKRKRGRSDKGNRMTLDDGYGSHHKGARRCLQRYRYPERSSQEVDWRLQG
jgi:hypothetical protein